MKMTVTSIKLTSYVTLSNLIGWHVTNLVLQHPPQRSILTQFGIYTILGSSSVTISTICSSGSHFAHLALITLATV